MSRFATLLLDLDGTLVDAFATIERSYAHTLPSFGRPVPTAVEVQRAVGGGLENGMRRFLPEDLVAAAVRTHLAHTDKILLEDVKLMPGARVLVQARSAAGATLGVFTNKRGEHARRICAHLGLTPFLGGVFGAHDTPWIKPQPEFAQHALRQLGAQAGSALLIGDSPFDVAAARAGGFPCWCVTTGTHTANELHAARAEAVFDDLFAVQAALAEGDS
jgi:HAD superfamily hydrolase (TIGR01509 family)